MASSRVRVMPMDRDVSALFPEIFDAAARSRAFAEFAREEIGKADAQNRAALGRPAPREVFVDGRKGAPLESAKVPGVIVAEYQLLGEALEWIRGQLEKHSPVGSGLDPRPGHPGMYRASHVLAVDGRAVRVGEPLPEVFEDAVFVSTVPYARKIERGLSKQAPDGVYEAVAALAQRRFGNFARIGFGWRSVTVGGIAEWAQRPSARALARRVRGGNPGRHTEWLQRQPAVSIRPR